MDWDFPYLNSLTEIGTIDLIVGNVTEKNWLLFNEAEMKPPWIQGKQKSSMEEDVITWGLRGYYYWSILLWRNSQEVLAAKQKDPKADTSVLEKQIDEMVYALYGPAYRSSRPSPEEIAIVEGKGWKYKHCNIIESYSLKGGATMKVADLSTDELKELIGKIVEDKLQMWKKDSGWIDDIFGWVYYSGWRRPGTPW